MLVGLTDLADTLVTSLNVTSSPWYVSQVPYIRFGKSCITFKTYNFATQ
ncbi:hypothetical protein BH10BAC2_BH10BAC2_07200 [soil metagenome]